MKKNTGSLDIDYIDNLFEGMSREAAEAMNGTHPPIPKKKKATAKKKPATAKKTTTKKKKTVKKK